MCSLALEKEFFVGKIPRDLYKDEWVPLFEKTGPIWDLGLIMGPVSVQNRGYDLSPSVEKKQQRKLLNCVRTMKFALVNTLEYAFLWQKNRLFVGSIPKNKTKANTLEVLSHREFGGQCSTQ